LSKSKKLLGPLIYCSVFKDQNPASARMCHAVFAASRHYNSSSLAVSRINSWGKLFFVSSFRPPQRRGDCLLESAGVCQQKK
jgi:hypothetical protein